MVCWLQHILVFTRRIQLFAALYVWKSTQACDWDQHVCRESSIPKAHFNICKTMAHWSACTLDGSASGMCHKPLYVCLWACVCLSGATLASLLTHVQTSESKSLSFTLSLLFSLSVYLSLSLLNTHSGTHILTPTPNSLILLSQSVRQVICMVSPDKLRNV